MIDPNIVMNARHMALSVAQNRMEGAQLEDVIAEARLIEEYFLEGMDVPEEAEQVSPGSTV